MKYFSNLFSAGSSVPVFVTATALVGFMLAFGFMKDDSDFVAGMYIEPAQQLALMNDTFEVEIMVKSSVPVNVFSGELVFNHEVIIVESIEYNTSIADLWAEAPWYSNGDGTLNFTGGTTRAGGFTGDDVLLKVIFKTLREGEGVVSMKRSRILRHDGLGTDVDLESSVNALVVVEEKVLSARLSDHVEYKIIPQTPTTDLNGDGKQTLSDISIFIINITGDDLRYDFNLDGNVDIKDLNIILGAK